jgi:hypothetical protein
MRIQSLLDGLRRFLTQTPLLFVSCFYVGGALGLLMQNLSVRSLITDDAAFGVISFTVAILLIFVAPLWGIVRSVWLLANNQSRGESLLALFLSLPLIFVVVGSLQRASAIP